MLQITYCAAISSEAEKVRENSITIKSWQI